MTPSVIPTPASNEAVRSCSPLVADRPFDDENPVVDNLKCVLGVSRCSRVYDSVRRRRSGSFGTSGGITRSKFHVSQ